MSSSTDTLRNADTNEEIDGALSSALIAASLATDTGIVRATLIGGVWQLDNDGLTRCYVEAYERGAK